MLVVGGAADMASAAFRQSMLQTAAADQVRGRLQGIFIVVVAGGPRIADVVHGAAAAVVGTAAAAAGGGVLVIVLTLVAASPCRRSCATGSRVPDSARHPNAPQRCHQATPTGGTAPFGPRGSEPEGAVGRGVDAEHARRVGRESGRRH